MDILKMIKDKGYKNVNQFALDQKLNASSVSYWIKQGEKLGYSKKQYIKTLFNKIKHIR
tara:strand:- start:603 stop:779 length:177 start_codon:yes stop_codon:yes gene_type:complete